MGQAAAHVPQQSISEGDDAVGDSAQVHELAGQQEERHGQQRE
jgi:hypothetical protein